MISVYVIVLAVACLVAVVCALPGTFLVVRGVALMSDAISHSVLLGIALFFLLTRSLDSPLLLVGAALAGVATVVATESIITTRCLRQDAAIGIVFPLFFSCGVLLISLFARDVHLDVDMVVLGEILFTPFHRLHLFGVDWGPYALWTLTGVLGLNLIFIVACYKELVLALFDGAYAHVTGFRPKLLYYVLMLCVSVTAVAAFDSVGSVVVVALMVTPAATAYLLANRLHVMLATSIGCALFAAVAGWWCAHMADVSVAGAIATTSGVLFLAVLCCAPRRGLLAHMLYRREMRKERTLAIVAKYLAHHANKGVTDYAVARDLGWPLRRVRWARERLSVQ